MKKYKKLIYIVIAIIVVAVLIYFVFIPQIESSFVLWVKNTVKKEEVKILEQKKANINSLKQEEKQTEELSNALSSMLPDKKEAGEFIIEIEALAISTNVTFVDVKFSEEKKTPSSSSSSSEDTTASKSTVKGTSTEKFKEMTFEMSVKGSYADVINFLKGLEKINRAITIEKCDLSETKGVIQANIKGKAYYKNG